MLWGATITDAALVEQIEFLTWFWPDLVLKADFFDIFWTNSNLMESRFQIYLGEDVVSPEAI